MSDNITISPSVTNVTVSGTSTSVSITTDNSTKVNLSGSDQITVTASKPLDIKTLGIAGPTGPIGPAGAGSSTGSAIAGEAISADTLVVIINNLLYEANPTNASHGRKIAGVAVQSGQIGASVQFITTGQVTGGSWVNGSSYFAGLAGVLSTAPQAPGAVWFKYIGFAQSATELVVNMGPTVYL